MSGLGKDPGHGRDSYITFLYTYTDHITISLPTRLLPKHARHMGVEDARLSTLRGSSLIKLVQARDGDRGREMDCTGVRLEPGRRTLLAGFTIPSAWQFRAISSIALCDPTCYSEAGASATSPSGILSAPHFNIHASQFLNIPRRTGQKEKDLWAFPMYFRSCACLEKGQ